MTAHDLANCQDACRQLLASSDGVQLGSAILDAFQHLVHKTCDVWLLGPIHSFASLYQNNPRWPGGCFEHVAQEFFKGANHNLKVWHIEPVTIESWHTTPQDFLKVSWTGCVLDSGDCVLLLLLCHDGSTATA